MHYLILGEKIAFNSYKNARAKLAKAIEVSGITPEVLEPET